MKECIGHYKLENVLYIRIWDKKLRVQTNLDWTYCSSHLYQHTSIGIFNQPRKLGSEESVSLGGDPLELFTGGRAQVRGFCFAAPVELTC